MSALLEQKVSGLEHLMSPVTLGELALPHRVVMAPLTRCRAGSERIPNDLMAEYYGQRAGAALILSEATSVSPRGVGYPDTPGIWNESQVEGWKTVTDRVHAAGGRMLLQLWHVGRISDPLYLDGELPIAPSAIPAPGHVSLVRPEKAFVTPHALETDEVAGVVEEFRRGAANARAAGFDGVEIHAANGYLIDQFLQSGTNQRTDRYGGSTENRARFLLEVVDAVLTEWSPGRVGVHLAPRGDSYGMHDGNPLATFTHAAAELGKRRLAFLCLREHLGPGRIGVEIKRAFGGAVIANEQFTRESAEKVLADCEADAVAFGKLFIANPDLPRRLRDGLPLNEPNPSTFYAEGPVGYTDYPFFNE